MFFQFGNRQNEKDGIEKRMWVSNLLLLKPSSGERNKIMDRNQPSKSYSHDTDIAAKMPASA